MVQHAIDLVKPLPVLATNAAPLCAWCLDEADQELGNGTHGICARHKEVLLAQWRARRKERSGGSDS